MAPRDTQLLKFLSLVLGSDPDSIKLKLDPQGWIAIDALVEHANQHGTEITREDVERIARASDQALGISDDGASIRANRDTTIEEDQDPIDPPSVLYYGTSRRHLAAIRSFGIARGQKRYVHLYETPEAALEAARQRDDPVALEVEAQAMRAEALLFYRSGEQTWLTWHVPSRFLKLPEPQLSTNRDLYLFVVDFAERFGDGYRDLEDYLRSVWLLSRAHSAKPRLPLSALGVILERAFVEETPPFESAWEAETLHIDAVTEDSSIGYPAFDRFLRFLVCDLRRMKEDGLLQNELRYFGMDSPTGLRWYNFDPVTFLECACQGAFGGGRSDADTDALLADSEEAASDEKTLGELSWAQLVDFLRAGASYE